MLKLLLIFCAVMAFSTAYYIYRRRKNKYEGLNAGIRSVEVYLREKAVNITECRQELSTLIDIPQAYRLKLRKILNSANEKQLKVQKLIENAKYSETKEAAEQAQKLTAEIEVILFEYSARKKRFVEAKENIPEFLNKLNEELIKTNERLLDLRSRKWNLANLQVRLQLICEKSHSMIGKLSNPKSDSLAIYRQLVKIKNRADKLNKKIDVIIDGYNKILKIGAKSQTIIARTEKRLRKINEQELKLKFREIAPAILNIEKEDNLRDEQKIPETLKKIKEFKKIVRQINSVYKNRLTEEKK